MPASCLPRSAVSIFSFFLIDVLLCLDHLPGLTSPGARMDDVPAEHAVALMAEGKQHALGVGLTKLSTTQMCVEPMQGKTRRRTALWRSMQVKTKGLGSL